jgi:alpha-ketoglutarate-dependent taurine dioxygenase
MALQTRELTPLIGSEVAIDIDTLVGGGEAPALRELLETRGVLLFRNLDLDDAQQVAIARTLGECVDSEGEGGIYKITLDEDVNERAKYLQGSLYWHVDGSLQPRPNLGAILRPVRLSDSGGQTEFCNTYAAYEELPAQEKERIDGLRVVHSAERTQYYVTPEMSYEEVRFWQQSPTKSCPLVWTHQSGRKSLLLGATCDYVEGMPIEESRALLAQLRDWATQERFVYHHEWELGDLLIWCNTGTMHRVLPYAVDSGRLMHRTILAGEEPLN